MRKRIILLMGIVALILVGVYIFESTLTDEFTSNLTSPVITLLSAGMIALTLKEKKLFKKNFVIIMVGILIWSFSDFVWLLYESVFHINPEDSVLLLYLYLLPNIFIMAAAILYFVENQKRWHQFQLVVDVSSAVMFITILVWTILLKSVTLSDWSIHENIVNILYILTDVITLSILITLLLSARREMISTTMKWVIAGVLTYITIDFIYVYAYWIKSYDSNTFIDVIYLISLLMFGFASYYDNYGNSPIIIPELDEEISSRGRPIKFFYFLIFPFAFALTGFIDWILFFFLVFVLLLYQYVSVQIRLFVKNEALLKKEHEYNIELEKQIEIRTSQLQRANLKLTELSIMDTLVSLPNRRHFMDNLNFKISELEQPITLFYMDLNNFKSINDLHGHEMGDKILSIFSDRLFGLKNEHQEIARLGGDEFALIDANPDQTFESMKQTAESLLALTDDKLYIGDYMFDIGISIGISQYPSDATIPSQLIKLADLAMIQAKKTIGTSNYVFYTSRDMEQLARKSRIELLLDQIDYDEEFKLVFQPQIDAFTGAVIGVEALLRWHSAELGFVPPLEFIKIAEEKNHIVQIGKWVIENAVKQIGSWNKSYHASLSMGINISALQFDTVDFMSYLEGVIEKYAVKPSWIDLEITETSTLNTGASMEEIFTKLTNYGIKISIDDFGTGYSSLFYIKRFNIDQLKIAKELIDQLVESEQQRLIVKTIILMAQGLNIKTIAEGVENKAQADVLCELGCDRIQGYYYSKPLSPTDFEDQFLKKGLNVEDTSIHIYDRPTHE